MKEKDASSLQIGDAHRFETHIKPADAKNA